MDSGKHLQRSFPGAVQDDVHEDVSIAEPNDRLTDEPNDRLTDRRK